MPFGDRATQSIGTDQRQKIRARVRQSLYSLVAGILSINQKPNLMTPEVFYESCKWASHDVIMHAKRGWGGDPRAHVKSTRWTVGIPIYLAIQRPDERYDSPEEIARARRFLHEHPWYRGVDQRILIASSSKDNACAFLGLIKRHISSNRLLRFCFPELVENEFPKWNVEEIELPGRSGDFLESYIETAGVTSRSTSHHYDLIIYDDPVHEDNWQSEPEIQEAIDWLLLAEHLLENPDTKSPYGGVILGIGNYWTRYDVRGYVEDNLADTYDIWHRAGYQCSHCGIDRCIRGPDCHLTDIPLWRERFSRDALERMRGDLGDKIFTAQILNDPRDPEQIAFHRDDLRWFSYDGARREFVLYEGQTRHVTERVPVDNCRFFMCCDPATSTDPRSCRSAVGFFAEDPDGRQYFLQLLAERVNPSDLIRAILDTWDQYANQGMRPESFGVESVSGQKFLVPALNFGAEQRMGKPSYLLREPPSPKMNHIVLLSPDSSARKEDRIRNLLGWRATENTLYVNVLLQNKNLFLDEWDNFPVSRSNDIVDMLAYSQRLCTGRSHGYATADAVVGYNRRRHARRAATAYGGW